MEKQNHLKMEAGHLEKPLNIIKVINRIFIITSILLCFCCNNKKKQNEAAKEQKINILKLDSIKSAKSSAIIKGNLIKTEGGDKYLYSKISIKNVLLNKTDYHFEDTIKVAYYNWHEGIPANKNCIIYLTFWPLGSKELGKNNQWMLIEGDGEYACECE